MRVRKFLHLLPEYVLFGDILQKHEHNLSYSLTKVNYKIFKKNKIIIYELNKGLIGKTFQRFFNRIWNYIFKGIIGTASVVIVMPILCFTLSMGSIILAILTPIWYPIFSLLLHIGFSLIFDWDYPCMRFLEYHLSVVININFT